MSGRESASTIQLVGAGGFGAILGWFLYYVNRYRQGNVQLADLVTLIGALGGGSILAIFPERTDLFGAYGLGLFAGFFGYFLMLVLLVLISDNFTIDWFLDGRRKAPTGEFSIPPGVEPGPRPPMEAGQSKPPIEP